jgi:hypothetical protein
MRVAETHAHTLHMRKKRPRERVNQKERVGVVLRRKEGGGGAAGWLE